MTDASLDPTNVGLKPVDWWDDLLPFRPYENPPGANEMLRLVAYDIGHPKRLRRVATICEDYGIRVQYSLFECWLDDGRFNELWSKLSAEIDDEEDRIAVYMFDSGAVSKRNGMGKEMNFTQQNEGCFFF